MKTVDLFVRFLNPLSKEHFGEHVFPLLKFRAPLLIYTRKSLLTQASYV